MAAEGQVEKILGEVFKFDFSLFLGFSVEDKTKFI